MLENDIWDKYENRGIIGSGGFSYVYKALNKKLGYYVAIKEINKKKYKEKTKLIFKESEIMEKMNLENSISLKETFENNQFYYIIMDLCICNLEEYLKIREECLSIYEIFEVLNQLNNTFKLLNKENIIHMDLKPSNILLSIDKIDKIKFKLSDYGSSKDLKNVNTITISGTPLTMAPEILKGEHISNKCDIWSLGIIIYYMLFRNYPYNGNTEFQILKNIESKREIELSNDEDLNDLIKKMLTIDFNKRISWDEYFNHPFFQKKIIQSNLYEFNLKCNIHSKIMDSYCFDCKTNICKLCLDKHNSHKIYPFYNIGFTNDEINEIQKLMNDIENNYISFVKIKDNINSLINTMKLIKDNSSIYERDNRNNHKMYYIEYLKMLNKNLLIENIYPLNILENNNYIICEYQIKNENVNKPIQILNSFEECKRENPFIKGDENEKEIIENCELYLNNKKIDFCYKYNFVKEGKYIIKISFKQLLKNMNYMFFNCSSLYSIDFSNFNSSNVINMKNLFCICSSLEKINILNLNTNNVINMRGMFYNCSSLKSLDLSNFKTNNSDNMCGMFYNCFSLESLDLSNFETNKVYNMNCMFSNCYSLKSVNISSFNPRKVINMRGMFNNCSSLISLDLTNFNAENVTDLSYMFYDCSSLKSLDLSKFNSSDINSFSSMFSGCTSLTSVNLSNFNTESVQNMDEMFFNCSSLKYLDLSNFKTQHVNNMEGMFLDCSSLQYLNLSNFTTNNVNIMYNIFSRLNENCKIIIQDENLLKQLKNK